MQVIRQLHCQACGNIVGQDCESHEGYTSCCNERAVAPYQGALRPIDCNSGQLGCSHDDDRDCPEWCGHGGTCAHERAQLAAMERQAEQAVERYYEGGWDATGEYAR